MSRKTNIRNQIPSFLIVCEGKKTEPLYFKAFHVGGVRNVQVKGLGESTINLVRETINLKTNKDYDQVWVVFDIDDCPTQQVNDAIMLAQKNGIEVAYSNQAFELWYLLHFEYHDTSIDRKQYMEKLTRKLGIEYKKSTPGLYVRLLSNQDTAIQNAKKLFENYIALNPCQNDPSTTVFRLVEELKQYSPDSRR